MRFDNKDTEVFMYLVKTFVADKNTYLLPTKEYYKTDLNKTLLGKCDDILVRQKINRLNMQLVLNTLFRANLIKVNWVMRKDIRYRPEKRIGNTRRRYITFIRREMKTAKEKS